MAGGAARTGAGPGAPQGSMRSDDGYAPTMPSSVITRGVDGADGPNCNSSFERDHWDTDAAAEEEASADDGEPDEDEEDDDPERFDVSEDALEAHRQVLEMSATIEILTRDYELLQRELLDAYKRLQEYSALDPRLGQRSSSSPPKIGTAADGGIVASAIAKLRTYGGADTCCDHERELAELRRAIVVKDTALTEALQERNEFKHQWELAERNLRELRSVAWGDCRPPAAPMVTSRAVAYGSNATMPMPTSSSPSRHQLHSFSNPPVAMGSREYSKRERFDQASTYQRKEDDEHFWRKQYKEAVRMRKHPSPTTGAVHHGGGVGARPSLKIFSYPNSQRHKGITDENVPFTRYIGISTRQNEIIKEQHRLLS